MTGRAEASAAIRRPRERSTALLRCTLARGKCTWAKWGAPSSIGGLQRGAWKSPGRPSIRRPRQRCCRWRRFGRALRTRTMSPAMSRLRASPASVFAGAPARRRVPAATRPQPSVRGLPCAVGPLPVQRGGGTPRQIFDNPMASRSGSPCWNNPSAGAPVPEQINGKPVELFREAGFPPQNFATLGWNFCGPTAADRGCQKPKLSGPGGPCEGRRARC